MGALMDKFVRGITLLSQICGVFAAALIAASVVIVCQMVFVRYVLNQTTIWQTDFVTFSIVAATFIGSPYLLLNRGHVNVDVLPLYLGQKGRYRLALASMLMSFAFCAVMTVLTFQFWHEAWENNWRSESIWRARLWIPYASMPIGLGIISLQYVAEIIKLVTGRDPPFGIAPKATAEDIARAQAQEALGGRAHDASFGGSPNGNSRPLTSLKISAMYCRLRRPSPIGIAAYGIHMRARHMDSERQLLSQASCQNWNVSTVMTAQNANDISMDASARR